MAIAQGKIVDIKEEVLANIPESDILYFYLGISHLPTLICSPLRKDLKPSLGIYINSKGHIGYRDFATGESGSLFYLLSLLFNIEYSEVFTKILSDFSSKEPPKEHIQISTTSKPYNQSTRKSPVVDIQVKVRAWKTWDREYWSSYGITKRFLTLCKVFPISHIFLVYEDSSFVVIPAEKYAYAYMEEKDNKVSLKIYQPYSKSYKWMNKHSSDVWDLWNQLPATGDTLIITSSRKDAMCIWCNTGIPSCSLQAESYLPKASVIEELKARFKHIFVLYDNDFTKDINHGREYGKNIANTFNLKQIELPEELQAKDSSDLYKLHGKEVLVQTILNLTKS